MIIDKLTPEQSRLIDDSLVLLSDNSEAKFITWDDFDPETAMEGMDNALIGIDLGFGKDTQATIRVENPYYRPFASFVPFTEADKKAFKRIEKNMQKHQKAAEENRNSDSYNELIHR